MLFLLYFSSIPLDVLADLDLSKDDWHVLLAKKSWDNNRYFASDVFPDDLAVAGRENRKRNRHGINSLTKRIVRLLKASGSESSSSGKSLDVADLHSLARKKRTTSESTNMVCDCCYNMCSPEELGTYC
ncbi:insulin-like peptide II [Elysia marginata]|uniref:Insulin-like peptide II n=1 Tax=Elysia marginata TaxID=1093978 RepID=A0AAV4EUC8_9GAST|nr:insulin-like peptide II [Elysia marginata]